MFTLLRVAALFLVVQATGGCTLLWILTCVQDLTLDPNAACGGGGPEKTLQVHVADEFTFYAAPSVTLPNVRTIRVPVEQVPPFRFETTIGLCDPAFAPGAQATFGVAVGESAGGTGRWSLDCRNAGGLSASYDGGAASSFPGATKLDIAFAHDGTELAISARATGGDAPWQEIARIATGATTGVFLPDIWARDFQPGAMTSVYDMRFVANGADVPGSSSPRRAVREIAEATTPLVAALAELGDESPDPVAAATRLDESRVQIGEALTALSPSAKGPGKLTAEQKAQAKSRKSLTKASKSLGKTAALLRKRGLSKSTTARKSIAKATKSLGAAFDLVLPDDLRAAVGGLHLGNVIAK